MMNNFVQNLLTGYVRARTAELENAFSCKQTFIGESPCFHNNIIVC